MSAISDEQQVRSTLISWSQQQSLAEVTLSSDGSTLALDGTTLSNVPVTISSDDNAKSCRYTLTSIYLQLRHSQKVVDYRNACKQYGVSDPVKTLDKALVLGYFAAAGADNEATATTTASGIDRDDEAFAALQTQQTTTDAIGTTGTTDFDNAATAAANDDDGDFAVATGTSSTAAISDRKRKHKEQQRKDKKDRHGKKDRHRDSKTTAVPPQKKKPKMVTNEELLSNLNVVVDKRHVQQQEGDAELIAQALSADGFDVTPELLEEHKAKTARILSNEIPMGDSESILRAANPRRNLSRILELFQETMGTPPAKRGSGAGAGAGSSSNNNNNNKARPPPPPPLGRGKGTSTTSTNSNNNSNKDYLRGKKPIIVVPKGMTTPITLLNARLFFAEAKFVPRQEILKQQKARQSTTFKRSPTIIGGDNQYTSGGGNGNNGTLLEYEIVDNPVTKLGSNPKEWERIVAVIVLGQAWQFKDWLGRWSDPTYLFANTFGYYIGMEGGKVPAEIGQWSVKQARLNRDKRGPDKVAFASFWSGLDEFMSVHKRELLPQTGM